MARLQVNVDHVATVRQARRASEPDPVAAAALCELAGASGITVHLREDRRHIQDRDVDLLRATVKTRLNLEMAATDAMVAIATRVNPHQVTLVPEKREELTTEGGLDVAGAERRIASCVEALSSAGIAVSLFVDPESAQLDAARRTGANAVELHTGAYAAATNDDDRARQLAVLVRAASHARAAGLVVHAGHGLDYRNVRAVAGIEGVAELNIGFAIVARAVLVGLSSAVSEMARLVEMEGGR